MRVERGLRRQEGAGEGDGKWRGVRRMHISVHPGVCAPRSSGVCSCPGGCGDVCLRPCVSGCSCALERLRVLCVHVSLSVVYVCVHDRVTLPCVYRRVLDLRAEPALRFHGAAGCRARITEAVAPPAFPGFKDARTFRGPEASHWGVGWDGGKREGAQGPEGRRGLGRRRGLTSLGRGWGEGAGPEHRCPCIALPRSPGWTCS